MSDFLKDWLAVEILLAIAGLIRLRLCRTSRSSCRTISTPSTEEVNGAARGRAETFVVCLVALNNYVEVSGYRSTFSCYCTRRGSSQRLGEVGHYLGEVSADALFDFISTALNSSMTILPSPSPLHSAKSA